MLNLRYLNIIFFLVFSAGNQHCYSADQDDEEALHSDEIFTIHLDEEIINKTGLQTKTLTYTLYTPEIESFATQIDLTPLLDARKKYLVAVAQQTIARIKYKKSQQDLKRLIHLQRDKAIATRKLRTQESQLEIDKANYKASKEHAETILLHTRSKWGNKLSHWFLSESPPYTNLLDTLNKALYLVQLPISVSTPPKNIVVHPFGLREKAYTAKLISSAAIVNTQQTGTPFFYLSDQIINTYHQRVVVWIPLREKKSGFIIPESAIIWYLGHSYVYLQLESGLFKRIKVPQKKLVESNSFLVQETLHEGDTLVITGTQMLLSEEFKEQIPSEDDEDDEDD